MMVELLQQVALNQLLVVETLMELMQVLGVLVQQTIIKQVQTKPMLWVVVEVMVMLLVQVGMF